MKRIILPMLFLLLVTQACQALPNGSLPTLIPTFTPIPPPTKTFTPTLTPTITPTASPTPYPPITCDDASCLDACVDRIGIVLKIDPFTPLRDSESGEKFINIAKYKVKIDEITPTNALAVPEEYLPYQEDTVAHTRIWNYFAAILPPDELAWINEYIVFTDGKGSIQAWVRRSPSNPDKWSVGADILDTRNPFSMTEVLIHEFAHLLTLNTDQVEFSGKYEYVAVPGTGECSQYSTHAGCSRPNSYLNQFYQKFWTRIYSEWYESVYRDGSGLDWERISNFYRRHEDQFNTVYSAFSPEEDMAESFAIFVLEPKPTDDTIAAQKVLFFYDFPEFVEMRKYIIQGICSYTE